jgi:hypothetical protein
MPKGNQGESCAEAIQSSLKPGEFTTYLDLFRRVKQKSFWKDDTVCQQMMSLIFNLPFS